MKNKMARPRAPIEMDILFDSGIDKAKDAIMLGIKLERIIFHKGGYYEYKGDKLRMSQFREKFKTELEDGSLLADITSGTDAANDDVDAIEEFITEETETE
jgi:hypothetical protein